MIHILLFAAAQAMCSIYALSHGGAPERTVGAALLLAFGLSLAIPHSAADYHLQVYLLLASIDAALFVALLVIALTANRFWPLWIAAVQLLTLASHLVRAWDRSIWAGAYYLISNQSAWIVLALLTAGTWRHRRRLEHGYPEVSWSWRL